MLRRISRARYPSIRNFSSDLSKVKRVTLFGRNVWYIPSPVQLSAPSLDTSQELLDLVLRGPGALLLKSQDDKLYLPLDELSRYATKRDSSPYGGVLTLSTEKNTASIASISMQNITCEPLSPGWEKSKREFIASLLVWLLVKEYVVKYHLAYGSSTSRRILELPEQNEFRKMMIPSVAKTLLSTGVVVELIESGYLQQLLDFNANSFVSLMMDSYNLSNNQLLPTNCGHYLHLVPYLRDSIVLQRQLKQFVVYYTKTHPMETQAESADYMLTMLLSKDIRKLIPSLPPAPSVAAADVAAYYRNLDRSDEGYRSLVFEKFSPTLAELFVAA